MEDAQSTPTLIALCIFCSIAGMLFGYDTGVVSVAILELHTDFADFNTLKQEWFVSSTTLSAALGSLFCSYLNHDIGRRPVLLFGLFGQALGLLCFGLSGSYAMAIASRGLSGLLNGNAGVARAAMKEITTPDNRASGFSLFGVAWGVVTAGDRAHTREPTGQGPHTARPHTAAASRSDVRARAKRSAPKWSRKRAGASCIM